MREDFKERWEERRERWKARSAQSSKYGHIWTGLFILIIGVAALVRVSNPNFPGWLFSWQMLLIMLGLFIGVRHGFRGGTWLILILIGGGFLLPEVYPDMDIRRYIWPAILIFIGLMLILRPRNKRCGIATETEIKNPITPGNEHIPLMAQTVDHGEDFVDSTSIFGGAKKNIISKNFKGGDLVNIFGGTELDLTHADFTGTAIVDLTTIFGGTKFIVPSNWTVKSEAVTIFGGLEDKRNMQNITDGPEKVLLLTGTVLFGGIEIKSF